FSFRSDVIHLYEELNRLNEDFSPECNKHLRTISTLINGLKEVYISAVCSSNTGARMGGLGLAVLFVGFALFEFDEEVSLIVAGVGIGMAVVGGFRFAFGQYKKRQLKNIKRNIEKELQGIQDQHSPIIDILEKICHRTEEILRDASPSDHKAQALSERLTSCFDERHFFQDHDSSKVDDWMSKSVLLSRNLSEMISKICSVPEILKEIIEDNKRKRDKPAKPTHQQIEFKKNAEKVIDEIQRLICNLKNGVKEINQSAEIISDNLTLDFFGLFDF
ncbi:hypothetical protein PO909_000140, partial [Leuciscus waleckii]